ncbi:CBS domain-containing protein [Candidatus Izemoplasma sp. B36]|uniref:CBS domain-containing protein n=1 Tax=Candidatus Izemoplasma sp. B36 TaxID=3242468 RepID=UPI00355934B7
MSNETRFLDLFKKLEKHLRVEYNQNSYSYSGFMSTLYKVKKSNKNPNINNKHNFDIIQQASQIRNIISHNNDVLIPSDRFVNEFEKIVNKICDPLKVENIMIRFSKLKTVTLDSKISEAINLLKEHGYNTIPVIDKNQLMGIFTEKSIYDYLSIYKNESVNKHMKIRDILEAIDLNSDPRKYFEFISRHASIHDAYDLYNIDMKHRRELLLLLVTENGNKNEKLLGIVALRDVENALLN